MNDSVVVATFRTRAEAELAAVALEGAAIPFLIQSSEGMMHGPFAPGAQIRVPVGAAEVARDLLADVTAPTDPEPRHLVSLHTCAEGDLPDLVSRLDAAHVPYVVEHQDGQVGQCTIFVRREHQLPAGRALGRRA